MRIDQILIAVATPIGVATLYFLLAGEVSSDEAIACGITLVIVCPFAVAVARTGTVPMRLPARGLWSLVRSLGAVLPELWQTGRGLVQALRQRPAAMQGVIKMVPFRFGAFDPADIARRAAVGTALSVAPNGFVVGMDHERDELIVHQLTPGPVGGDPEWPL